jgi:hypothetical protein
LGTPASHAVATNFGLIVLTEQTLQSLDGGVRAGEDRRSGCGGDSRFCTGCGELTEHDRVAIGEAFGGFSEQRVVTRRITRTQSCHGFCIVPPMPSHARKY